MIPANTNNSNPAFTGIESLFNFVQTFFIGIWSLFAIA